MSLQALVWALENERVGSPYDKFVLVALANYASERGVSYPQVLTVCRITRLSDATVRRSLRSLQDLGEIRDTGKRFGPTQQVKVWQLNLGRDGEEGKDCPAAGLDPSKTVSRLSQDCLKTVPGTGEPRTKNQKPKEEEANASCPTPSSTAIAVVQFWNQTALPKVVALSVGRRRHLEARLKDIFWQTHWKAAILKVVASDFCMGRSVRSTEHANWRANFDWFLRPETLVKIMEGHYDNKVPIRPAGASRWGKVQH